MSITVGCPTVIRGLSRVLSDHDMSGNQPVAPAAQTGTIAWPELARHFARGAVVVVSPEQDLVAVAKCLVEDRESQLMRFRQQCGGTAEVRGGSLTRRMPYLRRR